MSVARMPLGRGTHVGCLCCLDMVNSENWIDSQDDKPTLAILWLLYDL
jgi:hypothetical protein